MSRLDDVRRRVLDAVRPLAGETVARDAALGRWLAAPVHARRAAPPVSCSAMDGFAVAVEDLAPAHPMRVVATVYAGDPVPAPLRSGETVRIYTGAPVPENAAAVVPQEAVRELGELVEAKGQSAPGANIRRAGEDVAAGEVALEAGRRLNARSLGLCAAVGADDVTVVRRPASR